MGEQYDTSCFLSNGYICNICHKDLQFCNHEIGTLYGVTPCIPYKATICNICNKNYDECSHKEGEHYGVDVTQCKPYTYCNICGEFYGSEECGHKEGELYNWTMCNPYIDLICNICGRYYTNCDHSKGEYYENPINYIVFNYPKSDLEFENCEITTDQIYVEDGKPLVDIRYVADIFGCGWSSFNSNFHEVVIATCDVDSNPETIIINTDTNSVTFKNEYYDDFFRSYENLKFERYTGVLENGSKEHIRVDIIELAKMLGFDNQITETKMPNGSRQFQVDMTRIPSTEIGWASFSSLTLSVIPGIGDLKDFQEVVTGVDLITGEYLSPGDRVVTVVCAFVPVVSGRACRVIKKGFVKESTLEKALKIQDAVNGCFTAGTVVSTEMGNLAIETVKAGDYVWSENPATGEKGLKEVVRTYIHSKSTLIHVYIDDTMIETTEEHPFWVENKGWTLAANLNTDDVLRLRSGETAQISKVEQIYLENPVQVYNFEVKDWHTYFVSEESVLVHNSCGADDIIKGAAEAVSRLSTRVLDEIADSAIVSRVKEIRDLLPSDLKRSGNFGFANVEISGIKNELYAHSGIDVLSDARSAASNVADITLKPTNPIYKATSVPTSDGTMLFRDMDTEYKILNNIAETLGDNTSISGKITLFTERPCCDSCSNVISEFLQKYKNITVDIIHNNGTLLKS